MLTLTQTAHVYWLACRGMRHGNAAVRPIAAGNIIGLAHGTGPVAERARKAADQAAEIIAGSDAA